MRNTLADDEILDRAEAATYLRQRPETLRGWAWKGRGPAYIKVGRKTLYRRADLDKWLDANRTDPARRALDRTART